jgi:hypothetical protein
MCIISIRTRVRAPRDDWNDDCNGASAQTNVSIGAFKSPRASNKRCQNCSRSSPHAAHCQLLPAQPREQDSHARPPSSLLPRPQQHRALGHYSANRKPVDDEDEKVSHPAAHAKLLARTPRRAAGAQFMGGDLKIWWSSFVGMVVPRVTSLVILGSHCRPTRDRPPRPRHA